MKEESMEPEKIAQKLRDSGGMAEVWHEVERFDCYRETGRGGARKVTVRVIKQVGHKDGHTRYMIDATSEDGKRATGNAQETIDLAIQLTHWGELDR